MSNLIAQRSGGSLNESETSGPQHLSRGPTDCSIEKAPLPLNLVEQFAKAVALRWVYHLNEGNTPVEMAAIIVLTGSILAQRTKSNAIGQRCLQAIEVAS